VITCECRFEAQAADEEGRVAALRRHAGEAHCTPLSHDKALVFRGAAHDPSRDDLDRVSAHPLTTGFLAEPRYLANP
jgi:hypothetical protein